MNGSSAAFRFEVPVRVCREPCRNFKSAALVSRYNEGALPRGSRRDSGFPVAGARLFGGYERGVQNFTRFGLVGWAKAAPMLHGRSVHSIRRAHATWTACAFLAWAPRSVLGGNSPVLGPPLPTLLR